MIEIYIFVNPLDYEQKKSITQIFKVITKSKKNIKFHIIPTVTMPLMDQYFNSKMIPRNRLQKRNSLFQMAYHIALNFEKLATLNKNAAIRFLVKIYDLLATNDFTIKDIDEIFIREGSNLCNDFTYHMAQYSDIAKEKLHNNLLLLNDLKINTLSSIVIYNFNNSKDFAIRLDSLEDLNLIDSLIESNSIEEAIEKQPMTLQ